MELLISPPYPERKPSATQPCFFIRSSEGGGGTSMTGETPSVFPSCEAPPSSKAGCSSTQSVSGGTGISSGGAIAASLFFSENGAKKKSPPTTKITTGMEKKRCFLRSSFGRSAG